MYSKFESLTEEKKKRIIEACIEEFSLKGYKNASTNNIVKNAEISKGILFHYFGNKKKLYMYVLDFAAKFILDIIFKKTTDLPADVFERIAKVEIIKLKIACEHSVMYKFLLDAYMSTPDELKLELQQKYEKIYEANLSLMLKGIDASKFRSGIDKDKIIELILFAVDGISNKYIKTYKNISADKIMSESEAIAKDYNQYLKVLKQLVYEDG